MDSNFPEMHEDFFNPSLDVAQDRNSWVPSESRTHYLVAIDIEYDTLECPKRCSKSGSDVAHCRNYGVPNES